MAVQLNNKENLVDKLGKGSAAKPAAASVKSASTAHTTKPASSSAKPKEASTSHAKPAAPKTKTASTAHAAPATKTKTASSSHAKPTSSGKHAPYTGHTGVYVNRNSDIRSVIITILKPDGTCGMFLAVPSPQMIVWMGSTAYRISGNTLHFAVQSMPDGHGDLRKPQPGDEQFIKAILEPGKKYTQGEGTFDFVSRNTAYFEEAGHSWEDFGEARRLEGQEDFDLACEIRKIILSTVRRYGNDFGW